MLEVWKVADSMYCSLAGIAGIAVPRVSKAVGYSINQLGGPVKPFSNRTPSQSDFL